MKRILSRYRVKAVSQESIGYLLSHPEATTANILAHNEAIAVQIAFGYCTSSFRDEGLLDIYNFLPVHLST